MRLPLGSLAFVFAAVFCQGIQAQQLLRVSQSPSSDTIPFQLSNHFLILAEGRVGAAGPLKFLLDTGFTHTIVDARIGGSLPPARRTGQVLNFDKFVPVNWTELPELQLGPLCAQHLPVMVGDLKRYSELSAGVDAIIGLDLLRLFQSVRIDYRVGLLTFKLADPPSSPRSENVPALTIQLTIQNRPLCLILDTGLQGMLLYSDRIRNHNLSLKLSAKTTQGHQGRLRGEQAKLEGIHFGKDTLQANVFFLPVAPNSLPADIDGFVGPSILGPHMIELDFAGNTIAWQ